jgi:hypothetical protein
MQKSTENQIIPMWDQLPEMAWHEKLAYWTYLTSKLQQSDTPVWHGFQEGKYMRMMQIPAGVVFVGRGHRHGHEIRLLQGSVILINEHERTTRNAPDSIVSPPGYHTVCFTLTDVLGQTVHPDNGERDLTKLENDIFEPIADMVALGEAVHKRLT